MYSLVNRINYGLNMDNYTLDRTDFEILRLLQNNAQESNKVIAAHVNLAPSTCHERIKRLSALGVITGHHSHVDPRFYGIGLEALFFIKLSKHNRDEVHSFLDTIMAIHEVRTAYLLAGDHDIIAHVWVKDVEHLQNLAFDQFTARDNIVAFETSVIFERRTSHVLEHAVK